MQRYVAETEVKVQINVAAELGTITALSYRVTDENDLEVVAKTALPLTALENGIATVTVAAEFNRLLGIPMGYRNIELSVTGANGSSRTSAGYIIESENPLVEPINSFVGLSAAEFLASQFTDLLGWDNASRDQRINALIRAANALRQMTFAIPRSDDQEDEVFTTVVPEHYESSEYSKFFSIESLTAGEYVRLPQAFKTALKRAQVIEANFLLGGDPIEQVRSQGLMSQTVGESSQFYRATKPLQLLISRRAIAELRGYVVYTVRRGRA